jgi:hypothetical protein
VLKLIDWAACWQVRWQLADFMTKFATKLETGWLPTNSPLHLQKERSNDQRILCKQKETQAHLLRCPQRGDWCMAFLKRLLEHPQKEWAAADIRVLIVGAAGGWM